MSFTKELLDVLKEYVSGDKVRGTTSSATHLKALSTIAKAESAVSEPVDRTTGWVTPKDHYTVPVLFNPYTGEPRDARDIASDPQGILIVPLGKVEMLATPPAEAKREPLTDEKIKQLAAPLFMSHYWKLCNEFARAIEAAHGIVNIGAKE